MKQTILSSEKIPSYTRPTRSLLSGVAARYQEYRLAYKIVADSNIASFLFQHFVQYSSFQEYQDASEFLKSKIFQDLSQNCRFHLLKLLNERRAMFD